MPSRLSSSTFAEAASSERSQILRTSSCASHPGVYSVRHVSSTSNGWLAASDIKASMTVSLWPSIQCRSSSSNTVGRAVDHLVRPQLRTASMITRRRSRGSRSCQRGSPMGWSRTEQRAAGQRSAWAGALASVGASSSAGCDTAYLQRALKQLLQQGIGDCLFQRIAFGFQRPASPSGATCRRIRGRRGIFRSPPFPPARRSVRMSRSPAPPAPAAKSPRHGRQTTKAPWSNAHASASIR